MSYQPRNATEQAALALFNAKRLQIVAYKNAHGGDLERAYQAVTGQPWPANTSVKIGGNGQGEITGDRTLKSILGRYVAPIGAAVATPFVGPELFGLLGAGGGATAATTAAAATTPIAAAAGGGMTLGSILSATAPFAVNAATNIYGAHTQANASRDALNAETTATDRATAAQAKANADALQFQKDVEARRQLEWQTTQDKNFALYNDSLARLAPFRNLGTGAVAQLGQPIPRSLGALLQR